MNLLMTRTILATSTALALVAGMAGAQSLDAEAEVTDVDGQQTTVGAEASAAGEEIVDTVQAAGDATGDALENAGEATGDALQNAGEATGDVVNEAGDAVGNAAEEGYSAASDAAARLDAALTADAVVKGEDGATIGTVTDIDRARGAVMLDLDGEMEGSLDAPIETVILPEKLFSPAEEGLVLQMTDADLQAAINAQIAAGAGSMD